MKFIEITGGDTGGVLRGTNAELKAHNVQNADRLDAALDKGAGALRAVQTLSMFEPSRVVVVTSPEKVSVANAREMAQLSHPGALIFSGEKALTNAVRKALPALESRKYPLPRAGDAASWVHSRFREVDVVLPGECVRGLADVATEATGAARIRHLAELLQACGLSSPPQELVESLTHDLGASEALWAASDAVGRGDLTAARPADEAEPIVALSMLARRLARIAAALESKEGPDALAELLEVRPAAVRMLTKDVRVSVSEVERAFDLVIDAAELCRRVSDPAVTRAAADVASLRAAGLMRGGA